MPDGTRKNHRPWWLGWPFIISLAVMLRGGLFLAGLWHPAEFLAPDSADYLRLAGELARQGCFGLAQPELFRVPGYPLWLSLFAGLGAWTAPVAVAGQLALDVALVWVTARLAGAMGNGIDAHGNGKTETEKRKNGKSNGAADRWAALWQAGSVAAAVGAGKLLSDSLFALGVALLLLALLRFAATPPRRRIVWLLPGAAAGALVLVRVVLLPFLPAVALYVAWRCRGRATVCFLLGAVLVLGGWMARNEWRAGYPGLSTVSAINLGRYQAAAVSARINGRAFAGEQRRIDERLAAAADQAAQGRLAARLGRQALLEHPGLSVRIWLVADIRNLLPATGDALRYFGVPVGGAGTLAAWQSGGGRAALDHYFGGAPWALALALPDTLAVLAKYLAALAGALWLWRRTPQRRPELLLVLALLAWLLLAPGVAAHPRFRVPAEPLLAVLAAWGVMGIGRRQPADWRITSTLKRESSQAR